MTVNTSGIIRNRSNFHHAPFHSHNMAEGTTIVFIAKMSGSAGAHLAVAPGTILIGPTDPGWQI